MPDNDVGFPFYPNWGSDMRVGHQRYPNFTMHGGVRDHDIPRGQQVGFPSYPVVPYQAQPNPNLFEGGDWMDVPQSSLGKAPHGISPLSGKKGTAEKALNNIAQQIAEQAYEILMESLSEMSEFHTKSGKSPAGQMLQHDPIDASLAVASSFSKAGATLSPDQVNILAQQTTSQSIAASANVKSVLQSTAEHGAALQTEYGAKLQQAADTLDYGRADTAYERQRFAQDTWKYYPKRAAEGLIEATMGGGDFPATERGTMNKIINTRTHQSHGAYVLPIQRGD